MSAEKLGVLGKIVDLFSVFKETVAREGLMMERKFTMQTRFPSCYANTHYIYKLVSRYRR